MRIEKIELIGFKSFAEKTTFHFHSGITCFVGPNGSGKSNIVDSFRWVLGEQSAKILRGEKMEEVIFNGCATKKQRGMSEVNLLVSFRSQEGGNGDSRTSTSIARRLYRSGESEYLMNRTQCRLKDIRDLFLDTGLDIRSYSIMEQGRINEVLNAKPQERRFLIEEVAGVMKYKVRKAEALSKLESSRVNIQRINDIISEVKRQINSLDRQVKKAERYKRLSAELRAIELRLAKREHESLRVSLDAILSEYHAIKEETAVLKAELNRNENTLEIKRIAILDMEKGLELHLSELHEVEKEHSEVERTIAVTKTEQINLQGYLTKLSHQDREIVQKVEDIESRSMELNEVEASLFTEADSLGEEIRERSEFLRDLEEELSRKEDTIESKRREVFRAAEEVSHLRSEAGKLSVSIENLDQRSLSISREVETATAQLHELEQGTRETDRTLVTSHSDLLLLNERKGLLTDEIQNEKMKRDALKQSIASAREDIASLSSRLSSLQEIMHEEFSGEILTEVERLHFITPFAEIIEVDEAYERAIESALSEKVKGFILSTFEDILAAASLLKQRGIGRTAFIPLVAPSVMCPEHPELGTGDLPIEKAILCVRVAKDRDAYGPLVEAILNHVYIVRDLSMAHTLMMSGHRFTYVTLDGEVLEPSGVVTIGEGRGILKRRREIRTLEALKTEKSEKILHLDGMRAGLEASIDLNTATMKDLELTVIEREREISLLRLRAETMGEERERVNRKLAYLHMELEGISREMESLKKAFGERETEIGQVDRKKMEAARVISEMQDAITLDKERYESERTLITELRLTLNSYKERLEAIRREREGSKAFLADLSRKKEILAEEQRDVEVRIGQCAEKVKGIDGQLRELVMKADHFRMVIVDQRERIRSESEGLLSHEQEMKGLRIKLDALASRSAENEVSIAEHRLKIEHIEGAVRQNHGVEIDSLDAEPAVPEDEERALEIKAKIQELGMVNLGTLEEYEELKARYDFLSRQQDDLNRSIAELEEAITKINSTTRKRLRDAFGQLSTKFSEVFIYLFGGGTAELVLTDEQNILDTGIDIVAQPPGKKLQNINLLSGGEKALTVLSLLFASFLIKPAPLCILDEVDAPLDESNVERFAKMLRELSDRIQFIVVTHNRVTMEASDYLYGITMEEPGVSKVISMQLVDAPV